MATLRQLRELRRERPVAFLGGVAVALGHDGEDQPKRPMSSLSVAPSWALIVALVCRREWTRRLDRPMASESVLPALRRLSPLMGPPVRLGNSRPFLPVTGCSLSQPFRTAIGCGGEGHDTCAGVGLRVTLHDALAAELDDLLTHMDLAGFEVEVHSAKAADLAAAQPQPVGQGQWHGDGSYLRLEQERDVSGLGPRGHPSRCRGRRTRRLVGRLSLTSCEY